MAEPTVWITIDDNNFETVVQDRTKLVMLVFWSRSRGSCHIMVPVIDHVAISFSGRLLVGRLDVDRYPQLSCLYSIQMIPTLMFFQQSQVVHQIQGAISTKALSAQVQTLLDTITH